MTELHFAGRKAVVVGGTSGIGLASAQALANAGAEVLVIGRSAERFTALAGSLPASVQFAQADVQDRQALADVFAAAAPFDHLVCAATGGPRAAGPFLAMDLGGFQGSFAKLWGYSNCVRLGAGHLQADGSIVLVTGFPARRSPPGYAAIGSVGCAIEGFMRAIVTELAPRRINVVSPGLIDTPMFPQAGDDRAAFLSGASQHLPIPRAGTADEVASAILHTLANRYMTGATLDVDGGAPYTGSTG